MSNDLGAGEGRLNILAALLQEPGSAGPSAATLRAFAEAAGEAGAARALRKCGLHDEAAGDDIRELRTLLEAWRVARRTAWKTSVRWMTTLFMLALMAGLAARLKLPFFDN